VRNQSALVGQPKYANTSQKIAPTIFTQITTSSHLKTIFRKQQTEVNGTLALALAMYFDVLRDEIELILKFLSALVLLVLASFYNYVRTLDRETLLNDILLLKSVMQGKCIYLKNGGKIIVIEGHKKICGRCTCSDCDTCKHKICHGCDKYNLST
jgi:hypothetical protein